MDWILPHKNQNPEEQNQEYASYIVHNIDTVDFLGTIHIASNKMKFFNAKTSSAVQFFAEKTSFMLMQTIIHRRVTLSEQRLRFTFSKFVPEEIIEDCKKISSYEIAQSIYIGALLDKAKYGSDILSLQKFVDFVVYNMIKKIVINTNLTDKNLETALEGKKKVIEVKK